MDGAAFEALSGVRVHFAPFLVQPAVRKSDAPLEDVTTSPNGFLTDKDSGGMFYVIRLSESGTHVAPLPLPWQD